MKSFKNLNQKEIIKAIKENNTYSSILKSLNCHDNTNNRNKLKEFIKTNNLDISHLIIKQNSESYYKNPKRCKYCNNIIPYEKRQNDFCNHNCSASFNNKNIVRNGTPLPKHSYCLNCGKEITKGNKYCNNTCMSEYKRKEYIKRWKAGQESGIKGTNDIAAPVRIYLKLKYNNSCQKCGWNQINEFTGLVPLQIHHIDGNCLNNKEDNLQLLCPNCHSLTENFGSRNTNCTRIDRRVR